MTRLDREFIERVGGLIAQLRMLVMLNKRTDLMPEVEHWEERRRAILERIDSADTNRVVPFRRKGNVT